MDNVTFVTVEVIEGSSEHAIIDHGDGSFTSMLKSTYEAQQAANEDQAL
jgi:isopentenyl phosphate kinase